MNVSQSCILSQPLFSTYTEMFSVTDLEGTNKRLEVISYISYTDHTAIFKDLHSMLNRVISKVRDGHLKLTKQEQNL